MFIIPKTEYANLTFNLVAVANSNNISLVVGSANAVANVYVSIAPNLSVVEQKLSEIIIKLDSLVQEANSASLSLDSVAQDANNISNSVKLLVEDVNTISQDITRFRKLGDTGGSGIRTTSPYGWMGLAGIYRLYVEEGYASEKGTVASRDVQAKSIEKLRQYKDIIQQNFEDDW